MKANPSTQDAVDYVPSFKDEPSVSSERSYSEDDSVNNNDEVTLDDAGELEIHQMALKLSKDVWTWKFFVVLIILSTAGFLSAAAYVFMTDSEAKDFRDNVSHRSRHGSL